VKAYFYLVVSATILGTIGYLWLANARLQHKLDAEIAQRKHDVAKAHIDEIDMTLAERLKTIERNYDANVTIDDGAGDWADRFGM